MENKIKKKSKSFAECLLISFIGVSVGLGFCFFAEFLYTHVPDKFDWILTSVFGTFILATVIWTFYKHDDDRI